MPAQHAGLQMGEEEEQLRAAGGKGKGHCGYMQAIVSCCKGTHPIAWQRACGARRTASKAHRGHAQPPPGVSHGPKAREACAYNSCCPQAHQHLLLPGNAAHLHGATWCTCRLDKGALCTHPPESRD